MTADQTVLADLEARFAASMHRHPALAWADVLARLDANPRALASLAAMEASGGEPDVVGGPDAEGRIAFIDCSPESPAGRRSLCFDREARLARKEHAPASSAWEQAEAMGIELLDEDGYRALQELGEFDLKTSSWVATPADIRAKGGALFCDRRFGRVFTYHNGVQSYYAGRGFRGVLRV